MSHAPLLVGPTWPPALTEYEHTRAFAKSDWAWEGLRRNPEYQQIALTAPAPAFRQSHLPDGAVITHLLSDIPETAKRWGPCPFC